MKISNVWWMIGVRWHVCEFLNAWVGNCQQWEVKQWTHVETNPIPFLAAVSSVMKIFVKRCYALWPLHKAILHLSRLEQVQRLCLRFSEEWMIRASIMGLFVFLVLVAKIMIYSQLTIQYIISFALDTLLKPVIKVCIVSLKIGLHCQIRDIYRQSID